MSLTSSSLFLLFCFVYYIVVWFFEKVGYAVLLSFWFAKFCPCFVAVISSLSCHVIAAVHHLFNTKALVPMGCGGDVVVLCCGSVPPPLMQCVCLRQSAFYVISYMWSACVSGRPCDGIRGPGRG